MMNKFIYIVCFFQSIIAVAADETSGYMASTYITDAGLWQRFIDAAPNWVIVFVPIAVAISVGCRALSEILFLFKDKTENKWDNIIWQYAVKFTDILAKILGNIGIGLPKQMAADIAAKEAEKK